MVILIWQKHKYHKHYTLLHAYKEIGLDITQKTKNMLMSHHHTEEQNHKIKTANKSLENVVKFKCRKRRVTNQNCNHEKINNSIWKSGNVCYHSLPIGHSYIKTENVLVA